MLGLMILSRLTMKRLRFLFAAIRTRSNEPKETKNSSLEVTSHVRRAREATRRKRVIWGVDRPTRSRRARRRGARLFAEARRRSGSAETTAAMSVWERPVL
jgi:hypothetical protein